MEVFFIKMGLTARNPGGGVESRSNSSHPQSRSYPSPPSDPQPHP